MNCDHCGMVQSAKNGKNGKSNGIATGNGFHRNGNDLPLFELPHKIVDLPSITVSFVSEAHIPTAKGCFRLRAYRDSSTNSEPIVLISGHLKPESTNVPVRVHDQCFTSEVIGSLKCDCKSQLDYAMDYMQRESPGMIIYLQQEGRGIGLANKILAYALQEHGLDTVEANVKLGFQEDERQYLCVPYILRDCGVNSIQLMTNNPRKIDRLKALGVDIVSRLSIVIPPNPHSKRYLDTKLTRMGHFLREESSFSLLNGVSKSSVSSSSNSPPAAPLPDLSDFVASKDRPPKEISKSHSEDTLNNGTINGVGIAKLN
uniref:GTP cyclohydrolase II n=1 Tax=Hirondellea gigas TaxID=1518452 RepID=A0A6A7GD52_9CRUS